MAKKKIEMVRKSWKIEEVFPRFVSSQMAKGVTDKTVQTYNRHFHSLGHHLDMGMSFDDLTKETLDETLGILHGAFFPLDDFHKVDVLNVFVDVTAFSGQTALFQKCDNLFCGFGVVLIAVLQKELENKVGFHFLIVAFAVVGFFLCEILFPLLCVFRPHVFHG